MALQHTIIGLENEFAKHSLMIRIPEIITNVINELYLQQRSNEIALLGKLKYELIRNRTMDLFDDDIEGVEEWNKIIINAKNENAFSLSYFEAPWLFSECYIYRKIESIVHKINFDVFEKEKHKALDQTLQKFQFKQILPLKKDQLKQMLLNSLWGNQMDLSLHVSFKNVQVYDENLKYLILDDFEIFHEYIQNISSGVIHIILDNCASEFLNDLLLADFMIEHLYASTVHFHCKPFPWFVSDVTLKDVEYTFEELFANKNFVHLATKWKRWREEEVFIFKSNYFWNMPFIYNEMEFRNPELFEELAAADLCIFKGDLNYRKLCGDRISEKALNDFKNIRCLAIRTCKSDAIVGVSENKKTELDQDDPKWRVNGKYGIIQYFHNKNGTKREIPE
eukprot:NODE_195_length_13287_cov_0.482484.p4 type:complete len:394 gc:universal NODE_195_length_13287_cov_0.482484:5490-6671(+)